MRARLFLLILPLLLASCGRRPTDGATEGDTLRLLDDVLTLGINAAVGELK